MFGIFSRICLFVRQRGEKEDIMNWLVLPVGTSGGQGWRSPLPPLAALCRSVLAALWVKVDNIKIFTHQFSWS